MHTLKDVFDTCGGVSKMAHTFGISSRAIYKWLDKNALPKTEYTGETTYSDLLAENNDQFSKNEILEIGRPQATA